MAGELGAPGEGAGQLLPRRQAGVLDQRACGQERQHSDPLPHADVEKRKTKDRGAPRARPERRHTQATETALTNSTEIVRVCERCPPELGPLVGARAAGLVRQRPWVWLARRRHCVAGLTVTSVLVPPGCWGRCGGRWETAERWFSVTSGVPVDICLHSGWQGREDAVVSDAVDEAGGGQVGPEILLDPSQGEYDVAVVEFLGDRAVLLVLSSMSSSSSPSTETNAD